MKIDREEAKRIIDKIKSNEKLTEDEVKYLMEVAKVAIKKLPEMTGSWILMFIASLAFTTMGERLVSEAVDLIFEDEP